MSAFYQEKQLVFPRKLASYKKFAHALEKDNYFYNPDAN